MHDPRMILETAVLFIILGLMSMHELCEFFESLGRMNPLLTSPTIDVEVLTMCWLDPNNGILHSHYCKAYTFVTMITRISLLCIVLAAFQGASAFAPAHQQTGRVSTARSMAPKFDPTTQKWIPTNDEESTPAYGPVGE